MQNPFKHADLAYLQRLCLLLQLLVPGVCQFQQALQLRRTSRDGMTSRAARVIKRGCGILRTHAAPARIRADALTTVAALAILCPHSRTNRVTAAQHGRDDRSCLTGAPPRGCSIPLGVEGLWCQVGRPRSGVGWWLQGFSRQAGSWILWPTMLVQLL